MFIDTHTHLYDEQLTTDGQQVQRAINNGVTKMLMPNCDSSTIEGMMALAGQWPEHCLPMMGLHPCYVKEHYKEELNIVAEHLKNGRFYAVGEIGLDYYWDKTFSEQQQEAFELQVEWALQYDLPIVIHSRSSTKECIETVRKRQNGKLQGVFHCFSGTIEEAQAVTDLGFYLGIGGVVTFKKSTLPDVVKAMPLTSIVLETDAPYLAPVPYRGKRNESSYIPLIAASIAEIKGVSLEEVAKVTSDNAYRLFPKMR